MDAGRRDQGGPDDHRGTAEHPPCQDGLHRIKTEGGRASTCGPRSIVRAGGLDVLTIRQRKSLIR
jgi:hypothetical protein